MLPVTLEISFFLMCTVESSSCSLCLHNWFVPETFVFFDITAKKENAVVMWEEAPSVFLFVEQVHVSEELSFGLKLEIKKRKEKNPNKPVWDYPGPTDLCCFGLVPLIEVSIEPWINDFATDCKTARVWLFNVYGRPTEETKRFLRKWNKCSPKIFCCWSLILDLM